LVQPRTGFQVASVHSMWELSDKCLIPAESSLIRPVLQCVVPEIEGELIPREQSDIVQGKILFVRTHPFHLMNRCWQVAQRPHAGSKLRCQELGEQYGIRLSDSPSIPPGARTKKLVDLDSVFHDISLVGPVRI